MCVCVYACVQIIVAGESADIYESTMGACPEFVLKKNSVASKNTFVHKLCLFRHKIYFISRPSLGPREFCSCAKKAGIPNQVCAIFC